MTDAPVTAAADARPNAEGPHDASRSTFRARPAFSRRRATDAPAEPTNTTTLALAGGAPA
jgi:hypothetical protein